jgi:hypothetical protein
MMKLEWPWKAKQITLEKDLLTLEKQLDTVFRQVEPRAEFAAKLRQQLVGKPKRERFRLNWQSPKLRTGLLVAGGVVSFVTAVIAGIRLVGAIVGMRQLQVQDEKPIQA